MSWYVLYTKPKTERRVASRLEEMELEVYCPCTTEIRQWSDRKKKVTMPLFRSYVFVKLKEKERGLVFDVPGVVRYLFWLGKPAIVRDEEIAVIRDWLENDKVDITRVSHLSEGDELIIAKGAMKDQKAIVKEMGKKRMKLIVPALGFTINAKINEII